MHNVAIEKYCGENATRVLCGTTSLWFSYETLVAFFTPKIGKVVVHENIWGNTTGKHLNAIEASSFNKSKRVSSDEFAKLLATA
jgi:hypothetical protein